MFKRIVQFCSAWPKSQATGWPQWRFYRPTIFIYKSQFNRGWSDPLMSVDPSTLKRQENWSKWSAHAALRHCRQRLVGTINSALSFSSSHFSHKRGCPRVLTNGGIFKSFHRVLKLCVWLLGDWRRFFADGVPSKHVKRAQTLGARTPIAGSQNVLLFFIIKFPSWSL